MYSPRNGWALSVAGPGDKSGIGVLSSNSVRVRCFHLCTNSLGKVLNTSLLDPAISKVVRQTEVSSLGWKPV